MKMKTEIVSEVELANLLDLSERASDRWRSGASLCERRAAGAVRKMAKRASLHRLFEISRRSPRGRFAGFQLFELVGQ